MFCNYSWICNNNCNSWYFKILTNYVRSLEMYIRNFLVYSLFLEAENFLSPLHYYMLIKNLLLALEKMSFIYFRFASLSAANCFCFSQCFEVNLSTKFNHPHNVWVACSRITFVCWECKWNVLWKIFGKRPWDEMWKIVIFS